MKKNVVVQIAIALLWLAAAVVTANTIDHSAQPVDQPWHDFGEVVLADDISKLKLQHTFRYRNELGEPDEVMQVKSSCGCTSAEPSTRNLAPGETLELPTTLELSKPGLQRSQVWVIMKLAGARQFELAAVGVREESVTLVEQHIVASAGRPAVLHLVALTQDIEPPPPAMIASAGTAQFLGWTMVRPPDQFVGQPGRWHGTIEVLPR